MPENWVLSSCAPSYQLAKREQPPTANAANLATSALAAAESQPGFFNDGQLAPAFKARADDDDEEDEEQQQQPEVEEQPEEEDLREGRAIVVINKAKQPDTPPNSLPSDPFANYTYEKPYVPIGAGLQPGKKARRTMIVGDVHGSLVGLQGFLKQVKFDPKQDEIILAGDLVAKGPQSLEVIDKAREIKARCVRGNHDDKVIRWKSYINSRKLRKPEFDADVPEIQPRAQSTIPSDLVENSDHHKIAMKMSKEQYEYLLSCPLILTIPKELSAQKIPIHVVHAGIDPGEKLNKQMPWVLVNVRNILKDGTPSRKKKKGESWAQLFNDFHSKRVKQGEPDFKLVYGHDAGRSLNVKKWSIGLDSGCVYGRALSAYVVETGQVYTAKCPDLGLDSDED
ncbi:hypothetical protein BGX23_010028 [Mortierella sp. AD031]|nr:hypothetical protein BGX23_010028 [Mortierella sp. AD031]